MRTKLTLLFAIGVLSLPSHSSIQAQDVEVGEVCNCGVLITKLVRKGIIDREDANEAWLDCVEEMCSA